MKKAELKQLITLSQQYGSTVSLILIDEITEADLNAACAEFLATLALPRYNLFSNEYYNKIQEAESEQIEEAGSLANYLWRVSLGQSNFWSFDDWNEIDNWDMIAIELMEMFFDHDEVATKQLLNAFINWSC